MSKDLPNPPAARIGTQYDLATGKIGGPVTAVLETNQRRAWISISNPRSRDGKYRTGFWFYLVKNHFHTTPQPGPKVTYQGRTHYVGSFTSYETGSVPSYPIEWEWFPERYYKDRLVSQGATAWKRMRPDVPDFQLAQSVLELKDFIPGLREGVKTIAAKVAGVNYQRRSRGKSELSRTGEWYLAINFGWLPVLNDVKKFARAQKSGQGRVSKLIRDEGKPVHRKRDLEPAFAPTSSYNNFTLGNPWHSWIRPSFVTGCYGSVKATQSDTTTRVNVTWCEASFRYWLPDGPRDVEWHKSLLNRNTDTRLTPAVVYNLVPWTWLGDYFTSLGDFMDNVSAGMADRLIADYAFIMSTTEYKTVTDVTQCVRTGPEVHDQQVVKATATKSSVQKARYFASPFGFGFKSGDLTPKQGAILGALGLSKLP